jgi:DDE family transposase
MEVTEEALAAMFAVLSSHLDERQRRLLAGAQARALGRGGIAMVARASGMARSTVRIGATEIDQGPEPTGRIRRPGAGRPKAAERDPGLLAALDALVEPTARGDPTSPLRWTCKSTRKLAEELTAQGHRVSARTVAELLVGMGYSLQATSKQVEGAQHPDRDGQFGYLNEQARQHLADGQPVISVDTKKKEVVGNLANQGREWQPKGAPVRVDVHDFPDPKVGKAIPYGDPYGVYDLGADAGWVGVGDDHDTAAFAVATIRRWWDMVGSVAYPDAARLLITADAGGSNGYRSRLWKVELGKLAAETGLAVTVCHFPPGTSKWNRIEHRLFSQISMNWRGRPLVSHEVVVDLIGATTTRTGLKVHAELDRGSYPTGVKVTDAELGAVPLTRHDWHGEWNYSIAGAATRTTAA